MPQGRTTVLVRGAAAARHQALQLRLTGPVVVRTHAERVADMLALIRRRSPELSGDDLALLTRTAPRGEASRRRGALCHEAPVAASLAEWIGSKVTFTLERRGEKP